MATKTKTNMTIVIGEFMPMGEHYVGKLTTLTFDADARLIPMNRYIVGAPQPRTPAFGLWSNHGQIGEAWYARIKGTDCVGLFVTLDDPAFPAPIQAKLVRQDELTHVLLWSRGEK